MIFTWKHFPKDTIFWILFLHHCILDRVSGGLGLSSDSGFWLQGCVILDKSIHFSDFLIIKQREYPRSFPATTVSGSFPQAGTRQAALYLKVLHHAQTEHPASWKKTNPCGQELNLMSKWQQEKEVVNTYGFRVKQWWKEGLRRSWDLDLIKYWVDCYRYKTLFGKEKSN